MNWDRVEGNWKQVKGQIQQKWGKLTDNDLGVIEGKRAELAGRLHSTGLRIRSSSFSRTD
jgi:uncharacterized protein YjbJ (UPF0337 family)